MSPIQVFSSFLSTAEDLWGWVWSSPGGAPPSAPSSARLSLNSLREVAAFASCPRSFAMWNAWDSCLLSKSVCLLDRTSARLNAAFSPSLLALEPPRARLLTNFDLSSSSDRILSLSSSVPSTVVPESTRSNILARFLFLSFMIPSISECFCRRVSALSRGSSFAASPDAPRIFPALDIRCSPSWCRTQRQPPPSLPPSSMLKLRRPPPRSPGSRGPKRTLFCCSPLAEGGKQAQRGRDRCVGGGRRRR